MVTRLANSELRDAGLLCLWGFILGELKDYKEEQFKYDEAAKYDKQNGDIYWFWAYSLSAELADKFVYDKNKKKEFIKSIKDFYNNNRENINNIIDKYKQAKDLRPMNPWIVYDLACELAWWSQANQKLRKEAIDLLHPIILNSKIKDRAIKEEYLEPIISDPDVKKYLS